MSIPSFCPLREPQTTFSSPGFPLCSLLQNPSTRCHLFYSLTYSKRAFGVLSKLHLSTFKIDKVFAVYNQTLVSGFVTTHKVQSQRYRDAGRIFFAKGWTTAQGDTNRDCTTKLEPKEISQRETVFQHFTSIAEAYQWNKDAIVILPVVHNRSSSRTPSLLFPRGHIHHHT